MRRWHVLLAAALVLAALSVAGAVLFMRGGGSAAPPADTTSVPTEVTGYGYCIQDTEGGQAMHYSSPGDGSLQHGPCPASYVP